MEVLLINPATMPKKDAHIKSSKSTGSVSPPLGLAYIAAVLEREKIGVGIMDCEAESVSIEGFIRAIKKHKPKIVGITGTTPSFVHGVEAGKAVKEADSSIKVILGGSHASAMPKDVLERHECFDYAIAGEGEHAFLELSRHILRGGRFPPMSGIYRRSGRKVLGKGLTPIIENLDDLPFPARHLLPNSLYRPPADLAICLGGKAPMFPYTTLITTRGCPFSCVFCSQPVFGRKFRARSAKSVVDELEHLNRDYGVRFVNIYDDTFTVDRKRVIDICDEIKKRKLDITFYCRSRVDTIDEELLRHLKSAGCEIISYGVEAGTDEIMRKIKKNVTVKRVKRIFKATHRLGIATKGYFMIGNPGERPEDVIKTLKLSKEIGPMFAFFSVACILPASELYDMALEKGIIKGRYDWTQYPPIYEEGFTKGQMQAFQNYAYRSFYLRPKQILKIMSKIRSPKQLKYIVGGVKLVVTGE